MQTILFKGQAAGMLMSAPDQNVFKRPMSYGARDLLAGMLELGAKHASLFGGPRVVMTEFAKRFNQLRFEECEQMYQTDAYARIVIGQPGVKSRPGIKPKTLEDLLSAMCLDKLSDKTWVHDHSVPSKNRMGDISQAADIYTWLVDNFLFGDFSSMDLGKISEMGRMCRLDTIKREAQQIFDNDKHTVPYLYAVIRGAASRDEIARGRDNIKESENLKKLAALGSLAMGVEHKKAHKFDDDQKQQWERDREFAALLRDLDK